MAETGLQLAVVLVYFGGVLFSMPAAVVAWGLSRGSDSFHEALLMVAAGVAAVVLAGMTVVAIRDDPFAGLSMGLTAAAAALVLATFPLFIGRQLLARWTALGADEALEYATLGWPVGLVGSLVLFFAPGGLAGGDSVATTSGAAAAVAWTTLLVVVTLGPAMAGLAFYHAVEWAT